MAERACKKCNKVLKEDTNFYKHRGGQYCDLCKGCLTMHIDNFNPDTFLWILQDLDYPYIPIEWNKVRDAAFAKNPNLNGKSVIGKYISKMKLNQYSKSGWADGERLIKEQQEKIEKALEEKRKVDEVAKQQFENGKISEAQYKTIVSTEVQNQDYLSELVSAGNAINNVGKTLINNVLPQNEQDEFMMEEELPDLDSQLTQEDKIALALKWGRLYKPSECIELEKNYDEMMSSFDIQDADTINTLILICKTNLKMNQAIDNQDIESFQKLSKVSADLRKSAKFTAAQNKEETNDYIDSIGELVAYCEKNGGAIPKYKIEAPLDVVDTVIKDLKDYTKELIYEDQTLARQIEDYLKRAEILRQQNEDKEKAAAMGLDTIELEDKDIEDYHRRIAEEREQDKLSIQEEGDN